MNDKHALDDVRGKSLAAISRNERWFTVLLVLCGLAELVGLVAVFVFMNWSDPTHRLIFAGTMLVYVTLALWIWALAMRNRIGEQRILRAVELLYESSKNEEPS